MQWLHCFIVHKQLYLVSSFWIKYINLLATLYIEVQISMYIKLLRMSEANEVPISSHI